MMGRALWIGAMIAIAAVVSYVQLDRQARYSPELAAGVPAAFRSFAQGHVTATALTGEDTNQALVEAQRLVKSRPIPAEHLRLLATAQLKAGKVMEAARTIQIAAKRGWRDPQSQAAMLRIALAAGDRAEAARRYAALLQNPATKDEALGAVGPLVFAKNDSVSRETLADLMADGVRWQSRFLARGARIMPADAFADIVKDSDQRGARFDCATLKGAAKTLTLRDAEAAKTLDPITANNC